MSQNESNRDYTEGKRSKACYEREISELKKQRDALLEACRAWVKVESEMKDNNPCPDLALSIGPCEVYGNMRSCWNVKSNNLPIPEDKTKHTGIDCPICGREFFVGDIINNKNNKKLNNYNALLEALKRISDIEDVRYTHCGFDLEVNNIAKDAIAQAEK